MAFGRQEVPARREPKFDPLPTGSKNKPELPDRPGAARNATAPDLPPAARTDDFGASGVVTRSHNKQGRSPSGRKRAASGGKRRSLLGRAVYWGLVVALWGAIGIVGAVAWIGAHLPAIQSLEVPKRPPSIQILGLDGQALATRGDMNGEVISLKDMPPYLPHAFIAIEDRRFNWHFGFDPIGMTRAAVANIMHRGVAQGGSTLTQQLAKNLFLTQERTLERKIQELLLALWLERKFSKTQILELYLNRIYFGSGAYGIEAAAQRYFRKSARHVTLAEAAVLAGLVKSPSRLAPTRNPDGAERRAQIVLAAMANAGFINEKMASAAMMNPAHAIEPTGAGSVNYVADWVMDVLDDLIGRVESDIIVETSVDPSLQAVAEKALVDELNAKGERLAVGQGAVISLTPDGAVRALVGGRNYGESQFNRAIAAKRQPGSAFKPFVYLAAIERGLTPETVREDRPLELKGWRPENYSREYFGPVTLTRALAMSLNTVSVRLTLEVGPKAVVQTAHRLGIASKLEPNPSIALGTSEVSLLELTSAYAPFANGGIAVLPHIVERVRGADGKILYRHNPRSFGRVIDERHVAMMNEMLQETLLSGTGRKAEVPGWPAAGKTGTSQDFRDAWFVGYTGHLVTGVWLGNDDNSPTKRMSGGGLPVDIWTRYMKSAHRGAAVAALPGLHGVSSTGLIPPGEIGAPVSRASSRPQATDGVSLDSWLMDKLFGRR